MSVEAENRFLPKSTRLTDVFTLPFMWHNPKWKTRSDLEKAIIKGDEKINKVASDLFTAGVAYFVNRGHSQQIRDMGQTMWSQLNQGLAVPMMTNNIAGAAYQLGIPPKVAYPLIGHNDSPFVITTGISTAPFARGKSVILLPLEFILNAKKSPIENLAQMAWIGSQLRDAAYGRITIDPQNTSDRAHAYEAHFLRHALAIDGKPHYLNFIESLLHNILRMFLNL